MHHKDLGSTGPTRTESDIASVRRPGRVFIVPGIGGESLKSGAIGLDGKNRESSSHPSTEGNSVSLRRPRGLGIIAALEGDPMNL